MHCSSQVSNISALENLHSFIWFGVVAFVPQWREKTQTPIIIFIYYYYNTMVALQLQQFYMLSLAIHFLFDSHVEHSWWSKPNRTICESQIDSTIKFLLLLKTAIIIIIFYLTMKFSSVCYICYLGLDSYCWLSAASFTEYIPCSNVTSSWLLLLCERKQCVYYSQYQQINSFGLVELSWAESHLYTIFKMRSQNYWIFVISSVDYSMK